MTIDTRRGLLCFGTAAFLGVLAAPPVAARDLSFEDRVRYQRAIEDVYWSHRIWPKDNPTAKPPLSEVMSEEVLRARVEDYLKKSTALEAVWKHPLTGEQLQAELDRMVRDTRSVDTLKDLFHALGDDPFVIAETLARQTLVDRLARDWYSSDSRFHGETKRQAEAARASCRTVSQMRAMGGEYREVTVVRKQDNAPLQAGGKLQLDASEWETHRATLHRLLPGAASRVGRIGELEETRDAFTVTAVLLDGTDETQLATVTFAKTPFDTWWSQRRVELSAAVDTTLGPYEIASPSAACVDGTWRVTSVGPPPPRVHHTAVWTGSEMLVWGGYDGVSAAYPSGSRYIPATDSWGFMSISSATIEARLNHTAVWTGTEMIVWGGVPAGTSVALRSGGRYNPVTDEWTLTAFTAATPAARQQHTAVWTGSVMVVWGGVANGGGMYDPSSDSWTATSLVGEPAVRSANTAVWTGAEMIVWGGYSGGNLNNGARFNPASNTWAPMSTVAAPAARKDHSAVWDGNGMIVWGGESPSGFELTTNTGGRYVPATNSWTATSTTAGVPTARTGHTAVWTGTRMLVWGGQTTLGQAGLNTGSSYDPLTQTWTALPTVNAPQARFWTTAIWTGTEMIVWGGYFNFNALNTGGRYSPASNTWLPTQINTAPQARARHASVWTGSEMIIWGGTAASNVGGRYAPATDTWAPIAAGLANRDFATSVWTGTEMILWGGYAPAPLALGSRYNPTTNVWSPMTETNAPARRTEHTAVWTGSRMIVWGGNPYASLIPLNTGGRYNPATDTWSATSTTGAPTSRAGHSAVWAGSSMIVWGGANFTTNILPNTGGRYDPVNDTWTPTSVAPGVPTPRFFHSSVWTGDRMIVWGGAIDSLNFTPVATGGLYDPAADTWSATSTGSNVPAPRHTAPEVWTGREMIVWGGPNSLAPVGGRYDPASNTWAPMSFDPHEPSLRYYHTAEWTGTEMIVWGGGLDGINGVNTGGAYCANACATPVTFYRDVDGDGYGTASVTTLACAQPPGYSASSTDCNDANSGINPGATELCDPVDQNCDGFADTGILGPVTIIGSSRISVLFSWHYWTPIPGALYDMVRGQLGTWPVGSNPGSEVCTANNVPDTFRDDPDYPPVGTGFWYLVRAVNSCGNGTYGFRTVHGVPTTERISATCP